MPAQPVDATPSNRLIGQHFSPIALLPFSLFFVRDAPPNFVIFAGASVAWGWSIYGQKAHRWLHKPIGGLDLEPETRSCGGVEHSLQVRLTRTDVGFVHDHLIGGIESSLFYVERGVVAGW